MHSGALYLKSQRHHPQHVLGVGGGWLPRFDPLLPRIPTRIALTRRAQKDGWILSINNQQSRAKTTMFFSPCFVSELRTARCRGRPSGRAGCFALPDESRAQKHKVKIKAWRLSTRAEGKREWDQFRSTCRHKRLETEHVDIICHEGKFFLSKPYFASFCCGGLFFPPNFYLQIAFVSFEQLWVKVVLAAPKCFT